jgi:hypothetical protein
VMGMIDNYAAYVDGGKDSMYPPEKLFGRDGKYRAFAPGNKTMKIHQEEIAKQIEARKEAVDIYRHYAENVRKNGKGSYGKTEAISRIEDILLGKTGILPRPYTRYEICRAVEDYAYDKRSTEEKYRAVAQNFFGGEKFYGREYLDPMHGEDVAQDAPRQVDKNSADDGIVRIKI